MSKTWFTSDTHFGHKKIIDMCKRPCASVDDMNEFMITRWNERVALTDFVYHLGDFSFGKQDSYLPFLNGIKVLIKGNHDPKMGKMSSRWVEVYDSYLELTIGDTFLVLCHYPIRSWNKASHGSIHLHGHTHGTIPGDSQCCDVGVDCWGLGPVSLDEIRAKLAASPAHEE